MKFLLENPASTGGGLSNLWFWGILIIGIAVLFIFSSMRNKKEMQSRQSLNDSLKKGTKIITYSGIYGTIVSMRETTDGKVVVIETGDDEHKSFMEIHGNSIASIDTKEMVVLDENGNDVTNNVKEPEVEVKEEVKEEPKAEEEKKEEKVQVEDKPKKERKKVEREKKIN